jgi:NADH-quinone oxidoreductase subunit L
MMIGLGTDFWGNSIFLRPSENYALEGEWLKSSIKTIPLIFSFSGLGLAIFHYLYSFDKLFDMKKIEAGRLMYTFLNRKWFFDKVYNEWISENLLNIAYRQTYQNIDRGILEFFGPQGISLVIYKYSFKINEVSLGFVFYYFFLFLGMLTLFLFFFSCWGFILPFFDIHLIIIILLSLFLVFFD